MGWLISTSTEGSTGTSSSDMAVLECLSATRVAAPIKASGAQGFRQNINDCDMTCILLEYEKRGCSDGGEHL
eukprot:578895-Pleurochrysis_carterae.AAC.1